jgi:hypothetical protein
VKEGPKKMIASKNQNSLHFKQFLVASMEFGKVEMYSNSLWALVIAK